MSKYRLVRFFWDTDRQVATVAMEITQLVLSQFKKNWRSELTNIENNYTVSKKPDRYAVILT